MDFKQRAVLVARISENRSGETEKVDHQLKKARQFAEARGWEVVGEFPADNVSGSKGLPLHEEAWEVIESGGAEIMVARDQARLTRGDVSEVIALLDRIRTSGARVVTYTGDFDSGNEDSEDFAIIQGLFNRRHSKSISKNQKLKQEQLLDLGLHRGGPRPFGYGPDTGRTRTRANVERPVYDQTKLRPDEAALIRSGTEKILRGATLASVTRDWNESGVTTSMGKRWTGQTVKAVLVRYRNAGLVEHKGAIYGEAAWPAIVTRQDVAAVRNILAGELVRVPANGRGAPERQQRRAQKRSPRTHLLSGVLGCAACGGRMTQKTTTQPTYSCTTPGCRKGIHYDAANDRVIGYVVARLAAGDPAITRMGGSNVERIVELHHERAELEEKKAKLTAAEDAGLIDLDVMIERLARIKTRRDEIDAELTRIRRADAIAGLIAGVAAQPVDLHGNVTRERRVAGEVIRERFDALDLAEQLAVVKALGRYEALPHTPGVRASKESARHRIKITPLDPSTGEKYADDEYATEGNGPA